MEYTLKIVNHCVVYLKHIAVHQLYFNFFKN